MVTATDNHHATLSERLRARRGELLEALITRVYAVGGPVDRQGAEYLRGLREAVEAGLDFSLSALEQSWTRPASVPYALLAQARLAARNRVSLDTILRRYVAGTAVLEDFVIEEWEGGGHSGSALQVLLRNQAAVLDQVLTALSEEYLRERDSSLSGPEERRADVIRRLLAGEPIDTGGLSYDFSGHHVGLVAETPTGHGSLRDLGRVLDRRVLWIRQGTTIWAWLGSRRRFSPDELTAIERHPWSDPMVAAIGQPAQGLRGWRLTHHQAAAALPVALRTKIRIVRHENVALLASLLRDELLASTLRTTYLAPLAEEDDGGDVLRATLRAYFAADRNVSSAAASVGASRHTVSKRLQIVERRIGRPLVTCAAELEAALRLQSLDEGRLYTLDIGSPSTHHIGTA